jgi:hypothetical protein
MNSKGFPDYIAGWTGTGSTPQDILVGYLPRSCTVIGTPPAGQSNRLLSKISPMASAAALSLPAGTIVQAIEFIPGGVRVSGDANESGWTYYATVLQ